MVAFLTKSCCSSSKDFVLWEETNPSLVLAEQRQRYVKGRDCHTLLLTRKGKYDKMRAAKHLIPFSIKPEFRFNWQAHLHKIWKSLVRSMKSHCDCNRAARLMGWAWNTKRKSLFSSISSLIFLFFNATARSTQYFY